MPTNPFFALQDRIRTLISGAAYFTGLTADQILTEQVGDLGFQVENALIPLGFGVVITTAAGKPLENDFEALLTQEDLNVSIIHNPTTDPDHSALGALAAAIAALHGASVQASPAMAGRPFDFFRVTGHQRRMDAPANLHVHELHVSAGLRLL